MSGNLKIRSHGKIGEAAVYAKCWMHGIPAYFTGGLKINFAGSDLILDTVDPRRKLWVQVKTGYPTRKNYAYLTQATSEKDLTQPKFTADFVVFVNLYDKVAKSHTHNVELDFHNLSYYVVPRDAANRLFREALKGEADRPKRDGTKRKLGNLAGEVQYATMEQYRDAWILLKQADGDNALSGIDTEAASTDMQQVAP